MFLSKIEKLKIRLSQELPGKEAQSKMAFAERKFLNELTVPKTARQSAVLIVLYPNGNDVFIPLIQRPIYKGVHSGQMAFPGGKRENSDTSLIHTAIRETKEEIGVQIPNAQILGTLTDLYIPPSNMLVLPVVAYATTIPKYLLDEKEVVKVVAPSLEMLRSSENQHSKKIAIREGVQFETPYFDVEGHTVWGATAMILSEFLEISKAIL